MLTRTGILLMVRFLLEKAEKGEWGTVLKYLRELDEDLQKNDQ